MKNTLSLLVLCFTLSAVAQSEEYARSMLSSMTQFGSRDLSNTIKFLVVPVSGDYVISASETNALFTTNLVFNVDTTPSNITVFMPPSFVNTFTIYNSGTNWVNVRSFPGNTFLTLPAAGGISYGTNLANKYAGKSQQFFMLTETNYVVSSDFRPLPNIIFDVTNNISIGQGGGDVTTAQLNAESNALVAIYGPQVAALTNISSTASNALRADMANAQGATNGMTARLDALDGRTLTNSAAFVAVAQTNAFALATTSNLFLAADMTTSNNLFTSIVAATNSASVTGWVNLRQTASAALTNIAGLVNNVFTNQPAAGTNHSIRTVGGTNFFDTTGQLNNWANFTTNSISATATNAAISILRTTATTVSGAGSGNTNYLITLATNALNDFNLGSSNVNIYNVAGSTLGSPIRWDAWITNLSAIVWGVSFQSGTNRWLFSGPGGITNAPSSLTNNTCLHLRGRANGTNIYSEWHYYSPAF